MKPRVITIFEGPDGAGKTTAARRLARATGARYAHLGPFKRVSSGLARLYVEAMLPALLGYQDVVLDRCWRSEAIYGAAYRANADRLGAVGCRLLERLALRCGAVLVRCRPPVATMTTTFEAKLAEGEEYLATAEQHRLVVSGYDRLAAHLPTLLYDYTKRDAWPMLLEALRTHRPRPHPLSVASAGRLGARFILVGEAFGEPKNDDPLYRWPFASFNPAGCSRWLTAQLEAATIDERELLWVNADQPVERLLAAVGEQRGGAPRLIALGAVAAKRLAAFEHTAVDHPQLWMRFHRKDPYPLLNLLTEPT